MDAHHRTDSQTTVSSESGSSGAQTKLALEPTAQDVGLDDLAVRRIFIPFFVLSCTPVAFYFWLSNSPYRVSEGPYGCDDRSNVWIAGVPSNHRHNLWNPAHILDINLAFGRFTFVQAKAIDIGWDFCIGRGFQALSGILVYFGYRAVMADGMVNDRMPHYEVLALQYSTTSLTSLWAYGKGCWQRRKKGPPHNSKRSILLLLSVLYVLSLPTWLSAITAYQTRATPIYPADNGDIVQFDDVLRSCSVLIEDADRIGLEPDYCVLPGTELAQAVSRYTKSPNVLSCYPHGNDHDRFQITNIGVVTIHGEPSFDKRQNCDLPSVFEWPSGIQIDLTPSVLHLRGGAFNYNDPSSQKNRLMSGSELLERGTCQQEKGVYAWGFSFLLLFSFFVVTTVLSALWCIVVAKCSGRLSAQQVDMVFGDFRTALVVARSMEEELEKDINNMTDKNIQRALRKVDAGLSLEHVDADIMRKPRMVWHKVGSADIPVGSEAYKAYVRIGYDSLADETICKLPRYQLRDASQSWGTRYHEEKD